MRNLIVLRSSLSQDAALEALRRSIDERKTFFSLTGFWGSKPVIGRIDGTRIDLEKRRYFHNHFAPHFYATLQSDLRGGTRIEGCFDMSLWVTVFVRLWLVGVTVFALPLVVLASLDLITGSHNIDGNMWIVFLVPPAMIAFGILLPKFGRLIGRGEEGFVVEHLQRTLAARIEEPREGLPN